MKKVLSLILAAAMLLACIPAVSASPANVSDWAQETVDGMYQAGLLPDSLKNADMQKNITRGQMCQMAVLVYNEMLGLPPEAGPASTGNFKDTKDPAINYAFEQGIVGGYEDGTFRPDNPLTRQDFFKITHNLMGALYWSPKDGEMAELDRFTDASSVAEYAYKSTQAMVGVGVVKGDGDLLRPLDYTTCEQAIAMFARAYEYLGNWKMHVNEEDMGQLIQNQGYTGISSWAIREVQEMQQKGLIPACLDNCNMSAPISREQMCSIAILAYNKATGQTYEVKERGHFTDTDNPDVDAAYELGIVNGVGNNRFDPKNALEREQFFKIMAKFMAAIGYPRTDARGVNLMQYKDGSHVSDWARPATRLMIYAGAVRGDGKHLTPHAPASIQEAVAVFLRSYKYVVSWKEAHPDGEDEVSEYTALIEDILAFARSFEGYPYVYGGNGPNYFDCSGFVLYVYKHFGYSFSRGAQGQFRDGQKKGYDVWDAGDLLPGDLVFFCHQKNVNIYNSNYRSINHVGLYLGNGIFIHASNPTKGVIISHLDEGYYVNHFWGGCHVIPPQ